MLFYSCVGLGCSKVHSTVDVVKISHIHTQMQSAGHVA